MSMKPKAAETGVTERSAASRALRSVVRLPFVIVVVIVKATLYLAWYIAFAALSALRPVVDLMILGGMVMLLLAFAVFVKPEAAPGMPYWAIFLMAGGSITFAMGYSKFVDWVTPPGETDPAERYRRRDQ